MVPHLQPKARFDIIESDTIYGLTLFRKEVKCIGGSKYEWFGN
jgi:hypothetical protein